MQERELIMVILPAFIRAVARYFLLASELEAIVPEIFGRIVEPPRVLFGGQE
jgi:hypothetical protein